MLHVGGGDVAERHDVHAVAGSTGVPASARAGGALQGHDVVAVAVRHQRRACQSQRVLEGWQHGIARQRGCRMQRDVALNRRRNGVTQLQHVAEHGLGHVAYVGIVEIQRVGAACGAGDLGSLFGVRRRVLAVHHIGAASRRGLQP